MSLLSQSKLAKTAPKIGSRKKHLNHGISNSSLTQKTTTVKNLEAPARGLGTPPIKLLSLSSITNASANS